MRFYITNKLYRLWALEQVAYSIRVFIALAMTMIFCWWERELSRVVPLFLGIIACALAETDDSWQGRIKAVSVTLICFSITSVSVVLLYPYPWLFAIGLATSSFALTLLGALGSRYSSIGTATLILSIYTMISVNQHIEMNVPNIWLDVIFLLIGASWYGILSIIWNFMFVHQPVQYALAKLFNELGDYLKLKATLIEPIRRIDIEQRRLLLAQKNSRVVADLNLAKETIFNRMKDNRHNPQVNHYLKLYFIAQDIHERASSSHYSYDVLSETFFHSDILFRCQRLLDHQGSACQFLAKAIRLQEPFVYDKSTEFLDILQKSFLFLRKQSFTNRRLLGLVSALINNLADLEKKLVNAMNPDVLTDAQDTSLFDREIHTFKEAYICIKQNLSFTSLVFRHALRLATALTLGYGVMLWLHPQYGFWILLTTVFVCRPSYGATRVRLGQRMLGTIIGVIGGWALISLFPDAIIESLIAIITGVLFFAYRVDKYMLSTSFITIMVLCCFNQIGNSVFTTVTPRLIDTFIGCVIAGLAVFLILPDWQGRKLNKILANTLTASSKYLEEIMHQYEVGKQDNLEYRVTRRNAHNADAALSSTLASMLLEPEYFRKGADAGFRFLVVSHTLLSYLSALGAHRAVLDENVVIHKLLTEVTATIVKSLNEIADDLNHSKTVLQHKPIEVILSEKLEQLSNDMTENIKLVFTELALVMKQVMRIRILAAQLQPEAVKS